MAIFAIIHQPNLDNPKLPGAISELFKDKFIALDGNVGWLVSSLWTAQEISEKLHITDGQNGGAIILEVAAYFGRANPNIWSWIKANWDTQNNG